MPECTIGNFKIYIEVPLLLISFAYMLSDSVKTNLIIYRTCYVTLGYNKSECALLGSKYHNNQTAELEKLVQPYASVINTVLLLLVAVISAILCLFVGPWSDRFGRKPVMTIPVIDRYVSLNAGCIFGFMMSFGLLSVFASFESLSPWYILIAVVPVIFTGGVSSYLAVLPCYITDVTPKANRGMRMGLFEGVLSLGVFLGNISSSYVLAATDYPIVFLTAGLCCLLNLLFTVFFIPESLQDRESESRLEGLLEMGNIREIVKTTFRKRQHYQRLTVLCCVLMFTIFLLQINGNRAVVFLFLREKFHWSLEKYTLYSAAQSVIWILGAVVGVYFLHKLFEISETMMILLGSTSMLIATLLMGLAVEDWEVYAAILFRSLGSVLSPMVRSLVSKIVPNHEVGKIFAMAVASETLAVIIGIPAYTAVYNITLTTNSAIFNFVSSGLNLIIVIIALSVIAVLRTINHHEDGVDNHLINDSNRQNVVDESDETIPSSE